MTLFTLPVGWVQYKAGLRRKVERVDAACDVIGRSSSWNVIRYVGTVSI